MSTTARNFNKQYLKTLKGAELKKALQIDARNKELDKFFKKVDKWVKQGDLTVLEVISRHCADYIALAEDKDPYDCNKRLNRCIEYMTNTKDGIVWKIAYKLGLTPKI